MFLHAGHYRALWEFSVTTLLPQVSVVAALFSGIHCPNHFPPVRKKEFVFRYLLTSASCRFANSSFSLHGQYPPEEGAIVFGRKLTNAPALRAADAAYSVDRQGSSRIRTRCRSDTLPTHI